jgi:hypothetical protein
VKTRAVVNGAYTNHARINVAFTVAILVIVLVLVSKQRHVNVMVDCRIMNRIRYHKITGTRFGVLRVYQICLAFTVGSFACEPLILSVVEYQD